MSIEGLQLGAASCVGDAATRCWVRSVTSHAIVPPCTLKLRAKLDKLRQEMLQGCETHPASTRRPPTAEQASSTFARSGALPSAFIT